ncbi:MULTISPECIES: hypothetical protein [Deefgea]|uniref:Uncharacterized protein n=1 Tax=Deefgea chitinilytica TaxID=570276 RepID=A0ABS2CBW3_9NEIS|nr:MULTISPECIES: hypothetical protein [Deefgea]MBM5571522.1 hypothetical protein [Deefgea chitinilytica]MBM9888755.1 hypothetical protein [Deefgea sp. CFH1-16]
MWSTIQSWFAPKPKISADDEALIERLVDIAHPHIRLARNYQSRLVSYIAWAHAHATALATQLPAPIALTVENWRNDRTLQLLFATPNRMSEIVGNDKDLQTWFATWPLVETAYVGLIADAEEKTRYGVSEVDGQIRQDVPQKLLVFSNHRIGIPAESADALVQLGALRILDTVANQAQLAISAVETKKKQIDDELINARTMLRMHGNTPSAAQTAQKERIKVLTTELQTIHDTLNPEAMCELLITELAATPDIVQLQIHRCNVDRMGVVDGEDSDNQIIELPELILQREIPIEKLILLVAVPRALMQTPTETAAFPDQAIF